MSDFADFHEPVPGDRFIPKDNVGHVIVIKATGIKTGVVTANSPNGTDAVAASVLDLDAPEGPAVYRDTLLFGGAFVDALRQYIGKLVVVRVDKRQSVSGRTYATPVSATEAEQARAKAEFAKGDPFAEELVTPAAAPAAAQSFGAPPF